MSGFIYIKTGHFHPWIISSRLSLCFNVFVVNFWKLHLCRSHNGQTISKLEIKGFFIKMLAISPDSDQTAPVEQSDLGLFCLLRTSCPNNLQIVLCNTIISSL